MAKNEKYHTDLCRLIFVDPETGKKVSPERAVFNYKEPETEAVEVVKALRMMYNGEIVFNRALYTMYSPSTALRVTAAGGPTNDPGQIIVDSYKEDRDGTISEVPDLEFIPDKIEKNEEEEEKSGTFIIRQVVSGLELEMPWKQDADKFIATLYRNENMTAVVYLDVPAYGGSSFPTVYYSALKVDVWGSGEKPPIPVNLTTTDIVEIVGEARNGASLDLQTGEVYAPKLPEREIPRTQLASFIVFKAKGMSGETMQWLESDNTFEIQVCQAENKQNTISEGANYSSSLESPDNIGAEGGYVDVEVSAFYDRVYYWSSSPKVYRTESTEISIDIKATLSGKVYYSTSVEGYQVVEVPISANDTGVDRTLKITVSAGSDYNKSYTIYQSGAVFHKWVYGGVTDTRVWYSQIPASGGTVKPYVEVDVIYYAEYSDGSIHYDHYTEETYRGLTPSIVTAPNAPTGGVSFNANTGAVYAPGLGFEEVEERDVFVIGSMTGSFAESFSGANEEVEWTWDKRISISQEENKKNYTGEERYVWSASILPDRLEGTNTIISVEYVGQCRKYYYWNSAPSTQYSDKTDQPMTIYITGGASATKSVSGSGTWTYDVGTSGTSDRTFNVVVKDKFGSEVASKSIVQEAPATFHYELAQVDDAIVSYEEAFAWANSVSPYIQVRAWFKKVWSNGTTDPNLVYEDHSVGESGFTISNAAGQPKNDSLATINSSTGVVSVKSLGETSTSQRPVFEVQTLYGTFMSSLLNENLNWQMNDSVIVEQAENQYHDDGDPFYEYTSSIKPSDTAANGELSPVDTEITVYGTARIGQKYYWDSYGDARKTAYTNSVLKVMLNRNFEDVRDLKGANALTTFNVGINSSTTTQRTFLVEVYDTEGRYNQSYYLTQQENSAQEYWEAPTLNGAIQVEDIPASGEAVLISVPIKQVKKRRVEGSSTSEVVTTYTGSVIAVAIEGQALSGAGVSFNNGYISANNLGTSDISRRTVYTLKVVTVTGQDSKTYSLTLPSWVEIKQAANTWEEVIISSAVDMTPLSGSFDVLGGSKTLMVYATNYSRKEYASGVNSGTTANAATVSLSATNGSISPTSMTTTVNGKAATLSVTENIDAAKTISVKATVNPGGSGEKSITASFSQPAVSYAFSAGSDKDCNGTASTVYVTFTSSRNGKAWQPSFTTSNADATIDTSNITMSGNVYTVPVIIKANPTTSSRDIVITATQTRYNGSATQSVTITQAGAASAVIRTVDAYGSWNSGGTAIVNITAYLSNDSSSSVTFSGIKVELRRRLKTQGYNPESAELVTTASYSGSVSVGAGGSSNVSISNITHTRSSSYYYWLAAYATQTTETTYNEIEEYEPEG